MEKECPSVVVYEASGPHPCPALRPHHYIPPHIEPSFSYLILNLASRLSA